MKILFLSNNDITHPLFEWLKNTEGHDNVILYSEAITANQFMAGKEFSGIEFIVSYNYSFVINKNVISLFQHRIVNLHTSLLPWNRGASPNLWSFIEGTPSGVTIHEIDEGVDTGDILVQQVIIFDFNKETLKSSYEKSHMIMGELFRANWDRIKNGSIKPKPQSGTTHSKKDSKAFTHLIDYNDSINGFIGKFKKLSSKQHSR